MSVFGRSKSSKPTKVCPHCGKSIDADAKFCPYCGQPTDVPLGPCPYCGEMVAADAKFCPHCGRQLGGVRTPDIEEGVWRKSPDEFAVRVEPADLEGRLHKELEVQPGQQVVLLVDGRADEKRKGPGRYTVDSLFERLLTLGRGRHVTGLLVDGGHVVLEFQLSKLYTQDDYELSGRCVVGVRVENPVAFFANVMKGRRTITLNDLRDYLFDEVKDAVQDVVGSQKLQELAGGLALKDQLANAVELHLNNTLAQSGLSFSGVHTADFVHPRFNALRKRWEDIHLSQLEREADFAAEDAQTADQRTQARVFEERAEVWEQMRRALLSNKMNSVRTDEDLKDFLANIDKRKLIRQEQLDILAEEFDQRKEDRVKARAHAAYLAELERDYSRKQAELVWHTDYTLEQMASALKVEQQRLADEGVLSEQRWQNDLAQMLRDADQADWTRAEDEKQWVFDRQRKQDEQGLHHEMAKAEALHQAELQAIRTDSTLSVKQKEAEAELARARLDAERQRIQHDEKMRQEKAEDEHDIALAHEGINLLAEMKKNKLAAEETARRIAREDELERAATAHQQELDLREQARLDVAQQQAHELALIQARAEMSAEALISLAGPDQARAIADLKQTDAMKGMTDEQVYALMAARSPQVAQALAERFKAMAAQPEGVDTKVQALYERMLEDIRQDRAKDNELRERTDERMQKLFSEALESQRSGMVEIARATSGGTPSQAGPVIITNPATGQPQVIQPGGGTPQASAAGGEVQICPRCHTKQPVGQKFCSNCGYKFFE